MTKCGAPFWVTIIFPQLSSSLVSKDFVDSISCDAAVNRFATVTNANKTCKSTSEGTSQLCVVCSICSILLRFNS
jgi:hypothetical protein